MQLWSLRCKPSTQTAIIVKSKERTRTSVFIWLGPETCCLKWKGSVFLDECLPFMALVWSGCTVTGVIFSNLFWEGFADYFKININILDNSWHADLDQTNVLISRWPARPPERQPALSEHVQEWYWDRERLTGQVSVSTTGLPALLDASLSSPWSQWFAGATNCMDLSAHPCLRNTDIFNFTSQKPSTPNTHMLHAYSLCHCCLSTSVQSETQQSSLRWIWWSFQEHRLPPSTESDAIAGKTHNK